MWEQFANSSQPVCHASTEEISASQGASCKHEHERTSVKHTPPLLYTQPYLPEFETKKETKKAKEEQKDENAEEEKESIEDLLSNDPKVVKWVQARQDTLKRGSLSQTRVHYMEQLFGENWTTIGKSIP